MIDAVDEFARAALSPEMRDGDTFKAETTAPADATRLEAPRRLQRPLALSEPRHDLDHHTINHTQPTNQRTNIMHIPKNDIPVKIDAPGAVARHLPDFGDRLRSDRRRVLHAGSRRRPRATAGRARRTTPATPPTGAT